jgi:uncharacterized protein DUF4160
VALGIAILDDPMGEFSVKWLVPELCRFFGIIIRMYWEAGGRHHTAYYQQSMAIFSIDPVELMEGAMPRRQIRFVEAWAELHQEELTKDWQRLQAGQRPLPIEPLK